VHQSVRTGRHPADHDREDRIMSDGWDYEGYYDWASSSNDLWNASSAMSSFGDQLWYADMGYEASVAWDSAYDLNSASIDANAIANDVWNTPVDSSYDSSGYSSYDASAYTADAYAVADTSVADISSTDTSWSDGTV
jgi:hypothetical protein